MGCYSEIWTIIMCNCVSVETLSLSYLVNCKLKAADDFANLEVFVDEHQLMDFGKLNGYPIQNSV